MSLKNVRLFLLDMDGTVYLGRELLPGAREFLELLGRQGKDFLFLTNNSSKSAADYRDKLARMEIHVAEDRILTSGEATVIALRRSLPEGARIFLLGTPSLERQFLEAGFRLVGEEATEADEVVLGFDTTLTYRKLWTACDLIRKKGAYVATHPDLNCPLEGGALMPDAGAMIAFIRASTGVEPYVVGKPSREIVDCVCEKYGVAREGLAMVGDRLYTDIALGRNAGITSILVLSGETDAAMYRDSAVRADYVFDSIRELGAALGSRSDLRAGG